MAQKQITGVVVSTKMTGSVVVEVVRKMPHPLYRKLILRSKKYIADSRGADVKEGDTVTLVETRKMAGNKHFTVTRSKISGQEGSTK